MDPIRIMLLNLFRQIRNLKVGGPRPPRKKVGEPKPMGSPWFRHLCAYAAPSFAGHSFRVISGVMWYYLPIHRCSFWFLFNLKYSFVSLYMYNSRIKLLTFIYPIKNWCQTWKIWLWKDWSEWHNWQKSQGNSHKQTRNQLWTPEGAKNFLREAHILHR